MKRYDIKLRSFLNDKNLYINFFNFMKKQHKNYIFINKISIVKSIYKNEEVILENIFINRNDKDEVKTLIKTILSYLNKHNVKLFSGDLIMIYYISANKTKYNNYIKNFINSSRFISGNNNKIGTRDYSTTINFKNKSFNLNKWYEYEFSLRGNIMLEQHIEIALKEFWLNIVEFLDDNYYILIQFKLKTIDNEFRSVSYLQTVNKNDLNRLINIFKEYWLLRTEYYHQMAIDSIIFSFKIYQKKAKYGKTNITRHKKVIIRKNKPFIFGGHILPSTMDITFWSGNINFTSDYTKAVVYLSDSRREYHVQLFDNYQLVQVKLDGDILLTFRDILDNTNDLSTFTRIIKDQKYIFKNGSLILKQIIRKANFLTKSLPEESLNKKYITMDLETRNINGVLEPYCICLYYIDSNGLERAEPHYITRSPESAITFVLRNLLKSRFNGYYIFFHNFSNFDAVFLIRILSKLKAKIKPIIKDGRIIDITVKYGYKDEHTIHFRDSYQLLPSSLASLAKDFKIEYNKGIFPYKFVDNPKLSLNYKGAIPSIEYFNNITKEQYDQYVSKIFKKGYFWDLEEETIDYCILDCKVLYLVIKKFAELIFDLFKIDVVKYPTLPSCTMAIYRTHFYKEDFKIPLLDGNVYRDIKQGYTGGMVDVYIPTNKNGSKVYSYDVNSLYPYVMANSAMPIGQPIYFEGNVLEINSKPFGIFEAEITSPDNINYPVLQTKFDKSNLTISPLGAWKGWYLSEELFNAAKLGYNFKITKGYLFEKGYIFKEFVNTLYKLKVNSQKGSPTYLISKLLLNSLYGKFGTDPDFENHSIIKSEKIQMYNQKYTITNVIDLGNNYELISYHSKSFKDKLMPTLKLSSVSIALAVTAYARIHMSFLKQIALNKGLSIYYMDTDSLALSGLLPSDFVGTDLGKLKLEHIFDEVLYLAPKVYGGKTNTYEYTKIKGLKNKISFNELKPLLIKNNFVQFNQEKWYKNIGAGNITIKNEIYTLMLTENKRELIFDNNNIFVNTKPIKIN